MNSSISRKIKRLSKRFYDSMNRRQNFSLPDSIIHYIYKNPTTPEIYQKMIQTCKYFFIKNPILITSDAYLTFKRKTWFLHYRTNAKMQPIEIDMKKFSSKIWILQGLQILNSLNTEKSLPRCLKFVVSNLKTFENVKENILFNDLVFIASNCEKLCLYDCAVINDDGSVVALEKIIEMFPKLITFNYNNIDPKSVSSKTVQELLIIPHFSDLTLLSLRDIPENFEVESFFGYVRGNKTTKIQLSFCDKISDGYKARLRKLIDDIFAEENRDYKVPYIYFPGNSGKCLSELHDKF